MLFDQHIGDVFVARVAGNFENNDILGVEMLVLLLGASSLLPRMLAVVSKAACDGVELGHITELLSSIQPAVDKAQR